MQTSNDQGHGCAHCVGGGGAAYLRVSPFIVGSKQASKQASKREESRVSPPAGKDAPLPSWAMVQDGPELVGKLLSSFELLNLDLDLKPFTKRVRFLQHSVMLCVSM